MEKGEILDIAMEALNRFQHPIDEPVFKVMGKRDFVKFLKDAAFEVNVDKTPAFVAHLPDGELIVFCESIMKKMVGRRKKEFQRKFVEAVTVHELFHILNHNRCVTAKEAVISEEGVHSELKKEYPGLAEILEKFK